MLCPYADTRMENNKARIGVIGAGWWSTTAHIPALLQNPDAELVAVCDVSDEALARVRTAFGELKTYHDFREMLQQDKLDGVIIAVHHRAHYQVAKECLEHGLDVMLEKPMVLNAREANELVALAAQKQLELIIGYTYHFTPMTIKAREIIQSGKLGAIQFVSALFASMVIEFYRGNDHIYKSVFNYPVTGPGKAYSDPALSGGGQGHLQVTHIAGTLFFVTDLEPERVSCFMENWNLAVDLVDSLNIRFKSQNGHAPLGVIGSTGNLGVGDNGQMDLRVYCENGYLYLDQVGATIEVQHHDGTTEHYGPLPASERYPMFATSANLVDVILHRAANGSPAMVGARVVQVLDAAYQSAAEQGRAISIAELDSARAFGAARRVDYPRSGAD
jgi:predicted dehydrogenase